MPPRVQELLQQRNVQIAVGVAILVIFVVLGFAMFGGGGGPKDPGKAQVKGDQLEIAKVDSVGKAIEIQALMARQGLAINKTQVDNNISLSLQSGATEEERDRAVIALVQSGLMDRNVGLEAFDKGDLTASREEKRIKLVRAQQGELARLIRKIDPIEDSTVSLSIPENSLFRSQQKPMSASVQVQIPSGTRLDRDKVRAIINLVSGSIPGLDAQHVALVDTNGNTYNSVLDAGSELNDKLEEQDGYMKQKVASQLDKLVGPGNYVVTVSTMLREATRETMSQTYDPDRAVVQSKQTFNENLNAKSRQDNGSVGGPASSFLPTTLTTSGSGGSNRDYDRNGTEVTYENTRTQTVETAVPGMIEDISMAVTIDRNHYPNSMDGKDLQRLLARAASPKVDPNNVSVATVDFQTPTLALTGGGGVGKSSGGNDFSWIYWAAGSLIACVLLLVVMSILKSGGGQGSIEMEATHRELQELKEMAAQQQADLLAQKRQTQQLLESQQNQIAAPVDTHQQLAQQQANQLKQTLSELRETVAEEGLESEDLDLPIRSWIESS